MNLGGKICGRKRSNFFVKIFFKDARTFQILFLLCFITIGVTLRDFSISKTQVILTFLTANLVQLYWIKKLKLKNVTLLSSLVTSCGLTLLLRADNLWVHPLAATMAISSKFILRYNQKHIFNPANLGVILSILLLPGAWVSPAQWGHDILIMAWIFVFGMIVTNRAQRFDVSLFFLGSWMALLVAKILYLGQVWPHFWHQLNSGSLLLFTFFMISDPMTIPNHRKARFIYAFSVAVMAFIWQFVFFKVNGFIWACFYLAAIVPFLDRFFPAEKYQWRLPLEKFNRLRSGL